MHASKGTRGGHDSGTCPICLDTIERDHLSWTHSVCEYTFHDVCYIKWHRVQRKRAHRVTCPVCQQRIRNHTYRSAKHALEKIWAVRREKLVEHCIALLYFSLLHISASILYYVLRWPGQLVYHILAQVLFGMTCDKFNTDSHAYETITIAYVVVFSTLALILCLISPAIRRDIVTAWIELFV